MSDLDRFLVCAICFMFGSITYLIFPRDISIPDARELAENKTHFIKFVDVNGYICIKTNHPKEDNCNQ
jgi:hypothetical protein